MQYNKDEMNCEHCGKDLVAHHHRNLRCPTGATIYKEAVLAPALSEAELLKSFDSDVWAKEFVKHVQRNPAIPTDEQCMATWFANALMRGYDEHRWRSKEYKRQVRRALVPWWKRLFTPLENYGH